MLVLMLLFGSFAPLQSPLSAIVVTVSGDGVGCDEKLPYIRLDGKDDASVVITAVVLTGLSFHKAGRNQTGAYL